MISRADLDTAQRHLTELRTIEQALRALKAGAKIQSLTLSGPPPPPPPQQPMGPGDIPVLPSGNPPPPSPMMSGGFTTLYDLDLPPALLEGLAEHLNRRLQQITEQLNRLGVHDGA